MGKSKSPKSLDSYQVVVAGGGGTGKTCLVKQLILSQFFDELDPTIEDSYVKQVVIDDSVCLLDVLDTAGQEEYTAMREQYMRTCQGLVLVYSVTSRQSFEEARTFYNQILAVRGKATEDGEVFPLCLVGNKADLDGERAISTAEGFALAKEFCCDFVETSAKNRTNVDQCFHDLVRLIRTRRTLDTMGTSTGMLISNGFTIDLNWLFRRQKPEVLRRKLPIHEYLALTGQLVQAAKTNNERAVKKLLMKGADPDGHSGANGSAIYAAAAAGHSNVVELLLGSGAAVNARGPRGVTPLQAAAVGGHHDIVRLLLSKGVPVDERSRMYGTALLGACSRARLDVVRVLLEYGADINVTGGHEPYKKALHAAAVIGSTELARLLLSSGADIDARAPNALTALEMGCQHDKAEIVRLLLERGAQPNPRNKNYGYELKTANDRGNYNVVRLLLAFGASDELIMDTARLQAQLRSSSVQIIGDSGSTSVVDASVAVESTVPATSYPSESTIEAHSRTTNTISIDQYFSSTVTHGTSTPAVKELSVITKVRSSGLSRTWRFWKSKQGLAVQVGNPVVEESEERCGLFELYSQQSGGQPVVDIVAVHGLGGHWKTTWSNRLGSLWLRDFLPDELLKQGFHVRTLSYGYNSNTAFSRSINNIEDEAAILLDRLSGVRQTAEERSRPIILVAHSLGGIIAKKAMILAHDRSSLYGNLLLRIHSAVFFAVPHRGSDIAYWGYFAARLLEFGQLGFRTNSTYVSALRRNSKTFADISQQFTDRASTLHAIRTYYETERMGNQVIVDRDSARLGLPNEIAVGVAESDHRTICKIDGVESQKYKQIGSAMQALVQAALEQQPP